MTTNKNVPLLRFKSFKEDWENKKISDIAEVIGGGTPSTSNPNYWDGDINWYAPAEIGSKIYVDSSERKITELGLKSSSAKMLPADKTVLFTSRAGIGNTAILRTPAATNQGFQSMVVNDETNPYFIYSMTEQIKEKAESVASGSTFAEISGKMLGNLDFMFPSFEEQIQIGNYFENIDNYMLYHQHKIETLIKLKKSMLLKMFPTNGANVPEIRFNGFTNHWDKKTINEVILDIADGPFGSNLKAIHYTTDQEARIIQLSNIGEYGWQDSNVRYTTFEHTNNIKRSIVNEGELVMAKMMPAGMTIERPNEDKMYVLSSDAVRIKLDQTRMLNKFFLAVTKSEDFLEQISNDSQGSTRSRTSISKIRKMDVPITTIEEQRKIGEYFSDLDKLIILYKQRLETILKIKKALLKKMFV